MNTNVLTKEKTTILHGLAILMMVYHHLFVNGNTWVNNYGKSLFDYFDFLSFGMAGNAQLTFAWFCKICVAIFAFTSGYAMYQKFSSICHENIDIKNLYVCVLKRFISFYKKFFLVFMIFITIEYLTGNRNGFNFSIENYLMNLFGLRATFNGTWWYIAVYYMMLIISPFVYTFLKKVKLKGYLVIFGVFSLSIVIAFATGNLLPYLKSISVFIQHYQVIYLLVFMEGMFCGEYQLIEFFYSKLNTIIALIGLIVIYIVRAILIRAPSDSLFDLVFILPFIICFTKVISKLKYLPKFLSFFGKYSTYIWYCHAYFYSYLFFNVVIKSDHSLLVYIQVLLYSLACSIVLTNIEKLLSKLFIKENA